MCEHQFKQVCFAFQCELVALDDIATDLFMLYSEHIEEMELGSEKVSYFNLFMAIDADASLTIFG